MGKILYICCIVITRTLIEQLKTCLFQKKVVLLIGARQVGKSTLLKTIVKNEMPYLWLDGDESDIQLVFENATTARLKAFFGDAKLIVIDEAQKIKDIGTKLKLIVDYLPEVQIIATGSSAFEIRNKFNEPLTGRKFEFQMFPFTFNELSSYLGLLEEKRLLPHRLVYGSYPEVVLSSNPESILKLLADSYLYKDVLLFSGIKKPEKILDLLKMLAWQIGSEVNYNEIGSALKMKSETVEEYVHLLEKSFVVFMLPSYHTNQRNELKKSKKIYFLDVGIRNAIISDYRPFEIRNDKGALFENYIVSEIYKRKFYLNLYNNLYFWRTANQNEIDLISEQNGELEVFEIKWNPNSKAKISRQFTNIYGERKFNLIHSENYFDFLIS